MLIGQSAKTDLSLIKHPRKVKIWNFVRVTNMRAETCKSRFMKLEVRKVHSPFL